MMAALALLGDAAAQPTVVQFLVVFVALWVVMAGVGLWVRTAARGWRGEALLEREPRLHVPWMASDVVLLIFAWLVSDLIALRIAGGTEAIEAGEISVELLTAITTAHFVWALAAIAYLFARYHARRADLGFSTARIGNDVRAGVAAFAMVIVPVYALQWVVTRFVEPMEHPVAKFVKEHDGGWVLGLAAVSAVIVAPLAEELLFRVVLQGWLERVMTRARRYTGIGAREAALVPILLSSLAFALLHQGSDRVALFALALVLGYLYRQTHRIWAPLTLHMCFNSLGVVGLWLGVE